MANAARAPFYAPRPGDDVYWTPGPIANGAIRTTTTQVKFYGQPGQAPTKRYSPIYTFDDPAVWYEPTFQNGPVRVTLTQTKFYGQNGQTVTHNWAPWTIDDPSVWSGSPLASDTIHPLLTSAGQVKSRRWLFGLDDPSVWTGSPLSSDTIHPLLTAVGQAQSRQWSYTLDDPSPWVSWTNRNSRALQITTSPFAPYPWSFNNTDDAAPWQYTYQRSTLTPNTFGFNLHWAFNFVDDPPPWAPTAENLNSASIQILSSGGKPFSKLSQFLNDDPSVWYSYTIRNQPVLTPSGTPFIPTQWPFGIPVDEPWQRTTPGKPTSLAVVAAPFVPLQWAFGLSGDEPWQFQPPKAQPLSILAFTPFSPRFIPTLDDSAVWSNGLRPVSLTLTAVTPSPLTSSKWLFGLGSGLDDSAVWNAQSHNAFFTQRQPLSFVSAMWNLNIPQDTPTSPTSLPSAILYLPAPTGVTLIQRTLTGVGL